MVNGVVEHETFGTNPDPVPPAGHETVARAVIHHTRAVGEREGDREGEGGLITTATCTRLSG